MVFPVSNDQRRVHFNANGAGGDPNDLGNQQVPINNLNVNAAERADRESEQYLTDLKGRIQHLKKASEEKSLRRQSRMSRIDHFHNKLEVIKLKTQDLSIAEMEQYLVNTESNFKAVKDHDLELFKGCLDSSRECVHDCLLLTSDAQNPHQIFQSPITLAKETKLRNQELQERTSKLQNKGQQFMKQEKKLQVLQDNVGGIIKPQMVNNILIKHKKQELKKLPRKRTVFPFISGVEPIQSQDPSECDSQSQNAENSSQN